MTAGKTRAPVYLLCLLVAALFAMTFIPGVLHYTTNPIAEQYVVRPINF